MSISRKVTNQLCEWAEDGLVSWEIVARCCLGYMSEDDVRDMAISEGIFDEEDLEDED